MRKNGGNGVMYDVVALGECLIDFTPDGVNELGAPRYACNPGGAPANVLAMYNRLGGKTAFIGKVGQDGFGDFLKNTLRQAGIDVCGLCRSREVHTTLAFVQLDAQGDRTFSFYRKPGADVCLTNEEVSVTLLESCGIFHYGSVAMSDEPSRSATFYGARRAKAAGAMLSYDPNFRPALWEDVQEAVEVMREGWALADLVKVSYEEMALLTGTENLSEGLERLGEAGAALVLVTDGGRGCAYRTPHCRGTLPAYDVQVVDTTGSGDAFMGAVLHELSGLSVQEIAALPQERLEAVLRFANAAGGLTATGHGAILAMPAREQIEACVRTGRLQTENCLRL